MLFTLFCISVLFLVCKVALISTVFAYALKTLLDFFTDKSKKFWFAFMSEKVPLTTLVSIVGIFVSVSMPMVDFT